MGGINSKSPLERRNTVARRSQRRSMHNLKAKIDQLHKNIKKFKGTTQDANFEALKNEIEFFKNDLQRKSKDLQPQVRTLYENVYKRVCEAEVALEGRLVENREKGEKKGGSEVMSNVGGSVVDGEEVRSEVQSKVESELIDEAKSVRIVSPTEKRKSILKVGVAVMPGAMMNELQNRMTRSPSPPPKDLLHRIKEIVEELRKIEEQINVFVGKKNGQQYHRIKGALMGYHNELNGFPAVDDYMEEQVAICRNYIGSNLSFLDERATDGDDEVFLSGVEENFRKQKLLKNTSV